MRVTASAGGGHRAARFAEMAGWGYPVKGDWDRPLRPRAVVTWLRRTLVPVVAGLVGLALTGYAAVWAVPGLHRVVAESVLSSGHASWAWLVATPAQQRAWGYAVTHTPRIATVTRVVPRSAPSAASARAQRSTSAPCVGVQAVHGAHYEGWVLTVCAAAWVHVAMTPRLGVLGEQTSTFGQRAKALAAVNGGGFVDPNGEGTGGEPQGITVSDGHLLSGPLPDASFYVIGFDGSGRLAAGKWSAAQVRALGITNAVSFKPLLVVGGRPLITHGDGGWGIAPRAAIGQRADGTVLFAVIDGRQPASLGATLRQLQDLMLREGAVTAANLDGGSSATLWYKGRVLNHPCCSPNGERFVPTAWIVKPNRTAP